jgi:ubiquinone/menaquinone biosynthesis C-methylase UbiE
MSGARAKKRRQADRSKDAAALASQQALIELATGFWASQAIYVAAKLGLADLLHAGAKSVDELARATSSDALSLARLLRALATGNIFTEVQENYFGLTPRAESLRTDSPLSIRNKVIFYGEEFYQAWGGLLYSVQTGKGAFKHVFGQELYQYLEEHPVKYGIANASRAREMARLAKLLIAAYDFDGIGRIVDVGGGLGTLLAAVLKAHPKMRGVLFETPFVIEDAKEEIDRAGVSARCKLVSGDFLKSVPPGGDAYLLSAVLCSYDDKRAIRILKNCQRAKKKRGRLLILDRVIPEGHLTALNELVLTGGRERTKTEYRSLFAASGFELKRITPLRSAESLIEAT